MSPSLFQMWQQNLEVPHWANAFVAPGPWTLEALEALADDFDNADLEPDINILAINHSDGASSSSIIGPDNVCQPDALSSSAELMDIACDQEDVFPFWRLLQGCLMVWDIF